ncbi:uncharacterized protein [Palaemon carinicauda]
MVVVINSDEYIVAGDPAKTSWNIALEAVKQEAAMILSYPPPTFKINSRSQQQMEEVTNELDSYRITAGSGVKPHTPSDAEKVKKLLESLRRLEVEEKQNFREAKMNVNTRDFKAYAFAGLVASLSETLQEIREKEQLGSVKDLWHSAIDNMTLRHKYGLAFDEDFFVYQDATTVNTEGFSYGKTDSGLISLHAQDEVQMAPLLHARAPNMPFIPSNMMAKEIGSRKACPDCPDEPRPDSSILEGSEHPTVHIIVLITRDLPFLRLFFQRLRELNYPKDKLALNVFISKSAEALWDEAMACITENMNEYRMSKILPISEMDDYEGLKYFIERAKTQLMPDYLFIVEASTHLTNLDTLQTLINKRRNIVGPLIKAQKGDRANIETEYVRGKFIKGALYSDYVAGRVKENDDFSFIGLLQVPKITSAVLLSYQTYSNLVLSEKRPKENHWNYFFRQILQQGYIPYASNEVRYGYMISEPGDMRPDIWSINRNEDAYLKFYLIPMSEVKRASDDQSPGDKGDLSERKCHHFRKEKIFNSHFTKDLLHDVKKSSWNTVSSKEELDVFEPPEEMSSLQNIYVQSVVRYFTRKMNLEIPEAGGKLKVFQGAGHITLHESMNVLMSIADQKISTLEFRSKDPGGKDTPDVPSSLCLLELREGEGIFISSPNPWNIFLAGTTNIVVFSL